VDWSQLTLFTFSAAQKGFIATDALLAIEKTVQQ
jgi:hypothetical protein